MLGNSVGIKERDERLQDRTRRDVVLAGRHSAGWRALTLNHVGFAYVPLVSP